ncbi:MAG TPA: bifunctional phosphopantothenoylcysteine decarboxylase/phosphopantothenate--cysteine ligase CoaBC [Nitrospirae bacterium]|nr:coenzyme A biosynthesis bifunctional protein CoaBC [bacterium BMS3Abin06]HDH11741.1 bifunctional phosphopantothenoylcysteine decarboxylase/phosphopantothenate--cysteine ligase CoaBC [Nitrospirota bacterium]HDZ02577.1 bifunctional phosphopantothenoylcysteine decarboxylase/phosphopantothenate--cysteine ligase CoaBC [Nitrospirota bacterium]
MPGNRNILLGVTGSIAAYRSVDIARRLIDEGADVRVVMTEAACRFITPYTFEAVTRNPVHCDLFREPFSHINLSKESHLFIIAPATANTINKLSCGIADNLLSNLWLTYEGPVLMAPAMNFRMYRNPLVKKHIRELKKSGVQFVGPVSGSLACGEEGEGRMVEIPEIVEAAVSALTPDDLTGWNILVTAGPTIEPIDPVRFISNRSSGKMGYAIAQAALRRGADVTLISGPSSLKPPQGASFIAIEKASEMEAVVFKHLKKATSVIMAAAVSDYFPSDTAKVKLKKTDAMALNLKKNSDILLKLGKQKGRRILIGFAAESGKDIRSAKNKLKEKNLDLIVLNDISQQGAGFDVDTNVVTLINKKGEITGYPIMKKIEVANVILDRMLESDK